MMSEKERPVEEILSQDDIEVLQNAARNLALLMPALTPAPQNELVAEPAQLQVENSAPAKAQERKADGKMAKHLLPPGF